jgi:hypothetical protein
MEFNSLSLSEQLIGSRAAILARASGGCPRTAQREGSFVIFCSRHSPTDGPSGERHSRGWLSSPDSNVSLHRRLRDNGTNGRIRTVASCIVITFQPFRSAMVEADACSVGESYHLVNFSVRS